MFLVGVSVRFYHNPVMSITLKMLGRHIVRPSLRMSRMSLEPLYVRILKCHIIIAYEKLADLFCQSLRGGIRPIFR